MPWIVESGCLDVVYCFVTTESTAYGGSYQSLCGDDTETGWKRFEGPNAAHDDKDWSYAPTGGAAVHRHLSHLAAYGYVPGASCLTIAGYSDGGWLASMCALTGVAQRGVAWAGWSFDGFEDWSPRLPHGLRGMRLDLYISSGDEFYAGNTARLLSPPSPLTLSSSSPPPPLTFVAP